MCIVIRQFKESRVLQGGVQLRDMARYFEMEVYIKMPLYASTGIAND